jgi:hypothetical protein
VDKVSVGTSAGGLTILDYFAAAALQGYISSGLMPVISSVERIPVITGLAYDFAEGMLRVRKCRPESKTVAELDDAEILELYQQIFCGKLLPDFDNDKTRMALVNECRDALDEINQRELRKIFGGTA